jgi:Zn-dependent peptidase ImmA (M78 family)/ribosome-binding protein aMBF1 (putative translation factor)
MKEYDMGIQNIGDNVRRHMKIRGLTIPQLSTMMGMGTAALSNLLNGKAEPKSSTLIKLADALSVPFDELLVDAPKLTSIRFRTAKTLSGREKAERDQLRHDTAIWLSDYCFLEKELKKEPPYLLEPILETNPSSAALAARYAFGLDSTDPIYNISELMEKAGIKLRIRPYGFKKTFGLSIGNEDGGPGIVINSEKGIPIERQIFTVAHELGHLVLHKSSYMIPEEIENKLEEDQANLFAGTFLVPDSALEKEWEGSKGLAFVDRVLKVKKFFKVSYLTILTRIYQMGKASSLRDLIIRFSQDYNSKYHHDLKGHYEPEALTSAEIEPVAEEDPQELDVSDLIEERFARLVREAYEMKIISMSRAGEMLNLSIEEMRILIRAWLEL